jgi:hypothetical protein
LKNDTFEYFICTVLVVCLIAVLTEVSTAIPGGVAAWNV